MGPVIAIDGPAGTGKSTTTKRLAEILGFVHVDTGALYRAVAFIAIERNEVRSAGSLAEQAVVEIARSVHLEFKREADKVPANRIYADGRDLTNEIRTQEVSMAASRVSAIPGVRAALLSLQRRLGCVGRTILEGRDIGTVVFPDADVKIFLTASIEERAKRRLKDLETLGKNAPSFDILKEQIRERDKGDSTRQVAPLKKAEDAIEVDTSNMNFDQVVDFIEKEVRRRLKGMLG